MLSLIEIDRKHDLAYILLQPDLRDRAGAVARSIQVGSDIVLDLDSNEQLVGIELLNASTRLDLSKIQEGVADLIVGVKEAAEMLRVEKSNFIRDYANKPQFPRPIAELASGRLWLRSDIERYVSQDAEAKRERRPRFSVGEVVMLRSDPTVLLPIVEVIPGGVQYRYRVFQNNSRTVYYESQLDNAIVPAQERGALTVSELHAHLTSFQILSPSTAHLFSLRSGRVHFVPYQYRPVLRLIRADRPRLLIADEVGVGKTIEAGLIIKELRARMDITSVLIICPKALVAERKWLNEMKRFDEHFQALDGPLLRHCLQETDLETTWPDQYAKAILPFSLFDSDLVFGSNGRTNKSKLGLLGLNPPPKFDLVIVDEAHHIRNSETFLHQGVRFFCDNANAVLLLTATPVQLGSNDLFTLLNVLRPDLVLDQASFEQMAAPNPHINAAIQHCRVAAPTWQRDAAASLEEAAATEWGRMFLGGSPAFRRVTKRLGQASIDIEERIDLTQSVEDLYTFSSIINRTRRRDIGEFTTRKPETVLVDFTPSQKALHDHLLDVIARILTLCHGQQNVKFMMTTVRRQAASCLYGLAPLFADILNGKLDRLEELEANDSDQDIDGRFPSKIKEDVEALLERARNLDSHDPKAEAFVKVLLDKGAQPNNKALVFSTFRHTLAYLNLHAKDAGMRVALIHGDVPDEERANLRRRFALSKLEEDAIDVLLSSEVGCEGLDFQFCDFLINYDLPWNPMRVEQRIGRIDRIGQQSPSVEVFSLVCEGTIEARVYSRLYERLNLIERTLGGFEPILGDLIRELEGRLIDPSLKPEEQDLELDRAATAAETRKRLEDDLEGQAAGLIAHSDMILQRIKRAHDKQRWIQPRELYEYVKGGLSAAFPRSILDRAPVDYPAYDVRLCTAGHAAFRGFLDRTARRFETRLRRNESVRIAFSKKPEGVRDSNLEVVMPTHPLVRFIADLRDRTSGGLGARPAVFGSLALADVPASIGSGVYGLAIQRWSVEGITVQDKLVYSGIDLTSSEPMADDDAETLVGRAVTSLWPATLEAESAETYAEIIRNKLIDGQMTRAQEAFIAQEEAAHDDNRATLLAVLRHQLDTHRSGVEARIAGYLSDGGSRARIVPAERAKLEKYVARMNHRIETAELASNFEYDEPVTFGVVVLEVR